MESRSAAMEAVTVDSPWKKETKRDEKELQKKYTRSEMEALRFVQLEYQHEMFEQVYLGLEPTVKREFDGIFVSDSKNKKGNRNNSQNKRRSKSKTTDVGDFNQKMLIPGEELIASLPNQSGMGEICNKSEIAQCEDDEISDDDSYDGILKPAFFIDGEPDFESGPPVDGWEYLRRVRWEADQLPDVKVAKLNLNEIGAEQTPYMPKIPDLPVCPPNLLPSKKWVDAFLDDFSELRKAFAQLECSIEPSDSHSKSKSSIENQSQSSPTVTTILNMDVVSCAATLRNYIDMVESLEKLSKHDCLWLFSLCASVDTPLHADTCASLRCLLRKCLGILATKVEMDDEVAMLSVLVSICGKYFGQYDNPT